MKSVNQLLYHAKLFGEGWNYKEGEVFPQIFKMGGQDKMILKNFGKLALKSERSLIKWG